MLLDDFKIESIKDPNFLKELNKKDKYKLCSLIKDFLLDNLSITGGHLSSNLGIIELVVSLYSIFDLETTNYYYDVGHQSYIHKILTGRAKDFKTLRQYGGLSGYISYDESKYDLWESGHSSTSISAMSGSVIANKYNRTSKKMICIIGDASIINGVALEGLNFLSQIKDSNSIIILNDNSMSIGKTIGSFSDIFNKLRRSLFIFYLKKICVKIFPSFITNRFHRVKRSIKSFMQISNIFEDLGYDYYGPIDGHDIGAITRNLKRFKKINRPIVLHVKTKKGNGYDFAKIDKTGKYHSVEPFDIKTGNSIVKKEGISYTNIVANKLFELKKTNDFFIITPAMKSSMMLDDFEKKYNGFLFDVGIAEEHATVMACSMVQNNLKVILMIYSTFLQRTVDFLINDVGRTNTPLILLIDRCGLVGKDGSTHHGLYDISLLQSVPNFTIITPFNKNELEGFLEFSLTYNKPIAIRYQRNNELFKYDEYKPKIDLTWQILKKGFKVCIISYGCILNRVMDIIYEHNLDIMVVNARCIRPIDTNMINYIKNLNINILYIEETINTSNLCQMTQNYFNTSIDSISFDVNEKINHGTIDELLNNHGFSKNDILNKIYKLYEN